MFASIPGATLNMSGSASRGRGKSVEFRICQFGASAKGPPKTGPVRLQSQFINKRSSRLSHKPGHRHLLLFVLTVPASMMLGPLNFQPGKPADCPSKSHLLQQADRRSSRLGHRQLTSVPLLSHIPMSMLGPLRPQPGTAHQNSTHCSRQTCGGCVRSKLSWSPAGEPEGCLSSQHTLQQAE